MKTHSLSVRDRGFSGFGLIIVLLAIAVGLFLYFGSTGGQKSYMQNVAGARKEAKTFSIGVQAQQLATLVAEYRMSNNGKAPSTYDDMGVSASSFLDEWGHPLRFRFDAPQPRDAKDFLVISDGPDGKPDTEDDVSARVPLAF